MEDPEAATLAVITVFAGVNKFACFRRGDVVPPLLQFLATQFTGSESHYPKIPAVSRNRKSECGITFSEFGITSSEFAGSLVQVNKIAGLAFAQWIFAALLFSFGRLPARRSASLPGQFAKGSEIMSREIALRLLSRAELRVYLGAQPWALFLPSPEDWTMSDGNLLQTIRHRGDTKARPLHAQQDRTSMEDQSDGAVNCVYLADTSAPDCWRPRGSWGPPHPAVPY